jgi:hypothetical protein
MEHWEFIYFTPVCKALVEAGSDISGEEGWNVGVLLRRFWRI